jgi:hypothetical protein
MFKNYISTGWLLLLTSWVQAQCVVTSSDGYQVNISIIPRSIIVSTTDCPWGYNYNVQLDYAISFTGSNIPSNVYTLQTAITCGGQSNGYFSLPLNGGSGTATTTTNPFISNDGSAYLYTTHPDCLHATVQNLNCTAISITINGPGINFQTIPCNYTSSPLPVTLLDYSISQPDDQTVKLKWSTASEMRCDHYTIYRSTNGSEWEKKTEVKGAGTTTVFQQYEWLDTDPVMGMSYYKLTQTDEDGTTTDLGILSLERIGAANELTMIYPNPSATGEFNVRVLTQNDAPVVVVVRDQMGRLVQETTFSQQSPYGKDFLFLDHLNLGEANAIYTVELVQDGVLIGRHKAAVQRN